MSSDSFNKNNMSYQNQLQLQQQYQFQHQNQQNKGIQDQQQAQYEQNAINNNMAPKQSTNIVLTETSSNNPTSSNVYLTLLGLAESFNQTNQFRLTIHCLESILTLKHNDISIITNFHIQLKTRINLCRLYLNHTLHTNQYVNAHLEKSIILVQNLNANDEYKYEATYLIYKLFQKQKAIHSQMKQNGNTDLTQMASLFNLELIKKILETSGTYPVWHFRLLFLISDILTHDRDFINAAFFMTIGIEFCAQNRISTYTHILFILNKGLIHLLQRNPAELQSTMQPCASLIESFQTTNIHQVESLKIFFLVLQVTYFLQCGQMKSVKNTLKNLQHYVQSLACRIDDNDQALVLSQNPLENFQWLHKDHLGILVYLLTVVHSVQTGSYDKAQKLIEKALLNIQKLKLKEQASITSQNGSISYNTCFITNALHFMLVENMIRCNISIGNRCHAIKQIGDLFQLCDTDNRLMNSYSPQLHCLVGIYCLSMNLKEQALSQFNQSLKSTSDTDLWLFNAMNSAVCYLNSMSSNQSNQNIITQLLQIMDNLMPENIQTQNSALTAFSHYFRALRFYLNSNYQQAKGSLKEAILLSNSEELMIITANSYALMGHVDFLMGQFQESFEELNSGSELAEKLSDFSLKNYSNILLRDIFKYFNDTRETDINRKSSELEQKLSVDYYEALKLPHHALIDWNSNSSPSQIISNIKRTQVSIAPPMQANIQNPLIINKEINQIPTPIPIQPQQQSSNQSHQMTSQQQPNLQYQNMQQAQIYNNYSQQNNSPVNQQVQVQRLNIMSPQQQQYQLIQQQQLQQKMSPHQPVNPQVYNNHSSHNSPHQSHSINSNNQYHNNLHQTNNYHNQHQQINHPHHQQQQHNQFQQQLLIQQQQQQQQQQQHLILNQNQLQHNHHR